LSPGPRDRPTARRLPVGAEPRGDAGTHFRVWAPASKSVAVVLIDHATAPRALVPLTPADSGYHEGLVRVARPGSLYYFQLESGARLPDPASRFQPDGPHGPSEVVDPDAYYWHDHDWPGVSTQPVVYELHVGTFTPGGTLVTASAELPRLAALGVTMVELMPVAEFPGGFGWGYDGVLPYAPTRLYGRPDDLRAFVDHAHRLGLAVILDVVYNHFGPDGCPMPSYSPAYFAQDVNEWGHGLNYDGADSRAVREFILANAVYWISEFHLDGLRVDATQSIKDSSRPHILADLVLKARQAARGRSIWIVGENEPQDTKLLQPIDQGGCGLDALWNDDWHHAARVALTGQREAYYTDYLGTPQEFVSAARHGFLFQGQWYSWQNQPRGTATTALQPERFVAFLENHDQVANSLDGRRLISLASPGRLRALTALLLLGPWTPMLFQGQEYGSTVPFLYFADQRPELAAGVRKGRRAFLEQFPSVKARIDAVPDPVALRTFERSVLDPDERAQHTASSALHQALLTLRRTEPAFYDRDRFAVDGAVLTESAFVLRFRETGAAGVLSDRTADRLLLVNLGAATVLPVLSEPCLSPHPYAGWTTRWSSDAVEYGGAGAAAFGTSTPWALPAESATVLAPMLA
jgi:maltooligosyltrehalose trehalohydrolase